LLFWKRKGTAVKNRAVYSLSFAFLALIAFLWAMMNFDAAHFLASKLYPIGRYAVLFAFFLVVWSVYSGGRKSAFFDSVFWGKHGYVAALTFSVMLSMLPVFICWSGGAPPNYNVIGELIPWSDANGYFWGAEHLLHEGTLDAWNQRRPLNAAFFAARMAFIDENFSYALLLQAIFFGVAAFLATYAVARTHGKIAAIVMYAITYAFAAIYLPVTMSECFGLTLGLLAFALLWNGAYELRLSLYVAGVFMLTLALLARAGAMLVLPAFVFCAAYLFRGRLGSGLYPAMATGVAIVLAWLVNKSFLLLYGGGENEMVLANFSFVFYGLAAGGKGWMQVMSDYPQINAMSEAAGNAFVYDKALSLVMSEPLLLFQGLLKNLLMSPIYFFGHMIRVLVEQSDGSTAFSKLNYIIGAAVITPTFLWGSVRFIRNRQSETRGLFVLLLCFLLGFLLSLPFFYMDGGVRSTAATYPFVAAIFAMALLGWRNVPVNFAPQLKTSRYKIWMPLFLGSSIILAAMVGPMLGHRIIEKPQVPKVSCQAGEQQIVIRLGNNAAYLDIIDDNKIRSFVPQIRKENFVISDFNENAATWRTIHAPLTLLSGYDIAAKLHRYVVGPLGFVSQGHGYRAMCARNISNDKYPIWDMGSSK
jgi:hypothetical protein